MAGPFEVLYKFGHLLVEVQLALRLVFCPLAAALLLHELMIMHEVGIHELTQA